MGLVRQEKTIYIFCQQSETNTLYLFTIEQPTRRRPSLDRVYAPSCGVDAHTHRVSRSEDAFKISIKIYLNFEYAKNHRDIVGYRYS